MRIAIATEGAAVAAHFGKSESFTLVHIENDQVKGTEILEHLGSQHGLLAEVFASKEVRIVIVGNLGEGAKQDLASKEIEVISGITGDVEEVIQKYLGGALKASHTCCGGHGHECGHDHSHAHGDSGCCCSGD